MLHKTIRKIVFLKISIEDNNTFKLFRYKYNMRKFVAGKIIDLTRQEPGKLTRCEIYTLRAFEIEGEGKEELVMSLTSGSLDKLAEMWAGRFSGEIGRRNTLQTVPELIILDTPIHDIVKAPLSTDELINLYERYLYYATPTRVPVSAVTIRS